MIYHIYHWRGKDPPVPEAFNHCFEKNTVTTKKGMPTKVEPVEPVYGWAVHVNDLEELQKFVQKHGTIQLKAPTLAFPHWTIIVTEHGWGQR